MGLCDQNRGDGGYGFCYGLALRAQLRMAGWILLLRFFLRSDRRSEAGVVACGVCNVADQAALQILLRLKACIGNGFQLFVTL